jgi:hypothetical protein
MRKLLEIALRVAEGFKTMDWWSWWIVGDKLIEVGDEQSAGDHYATLYISEDPAVFGLSQEDVVKLKELFPEDDFGHTDPEEWGDIVRKVMMKNIRVGVNRGELYMDFPTEDGRWLQMVQAHRDEISKANPTMATISITNTISDVQIVTYIKIPIDEFWSAEKLSDLRAYRDA